MIDYKNKIRHAERGLEDEINSLIEDAFES